MFKDTIKDTNKIFGIKNPYNSAMIIYGIYIYIYIYYDTKVNFTVVLC